MSEKTEVQKTVTFGDYEIIIQLPNIYEDLCPSTDNNIVCFRDGVLSWNIGQLLERYAKKNHLNYFNDMMLGSTAQHHDIA